VTKHFLVFLLLGFAVAARADDRNDARVRALCERSNQVSGLKFDSPQPFAMKLKVQILKTYANPAIEGTVAFMDTGSFWREDLRFPEYGYSAISDDKKTWILRSTEVEPGLATETLRLINGSPSMRPFPNSVVRRKADEIRKKSHEKTQLTCIESALSFETCFDDATGATVSQSDDHARWEYKDFQDFHGKLVPHRMEYIWEGKPLIVATVNGLEDVIPDPKLFAPGAGYQEEQLCNGQLTHPKLIREAEPDFPPAYRGRIHGVLMNSIKLRLAAADGTVKDAVIIKTINNDFDTEALKAVRQFKFEPWKCDGVPMSRDITVQMNFHAPY
jgi:TonB family protein